MMAPLRLTVEELAVAARLEGRTPPAPFAWGWDEAEGAVAEAVALRGLIARGLIGPGGGPAGGPDGPTRAEAMELAAGARATLLPLLDPAALVELTVDETAGPRRRTVLGAAGGERRRAVEERPGLWRFDGSAEMALDLPEDSTLDSVVVDIGRSTLDDVERLLATGGAAFVPGLLERAGLPSAPVIADVLAAAVRITTVRAVRRHGVDGRAAYAYTWLETAGRGTWTVAALDDDRYRLAPATAAAIRAAMAEALALLEPAEDRSEVSA